MLGEFKAKGRTAAQAAIGGDRRQNVRLSEPFPAQVRGVAKTGEAFALDTVIDNISADGLYLRMPLEVDAGYALSAVVCFGLPREGVRSAPRLLIKGRVLRSEAHHGGKFGVAIRVDNYRFLKRQTFDPAERARPGQSPAALAGK